VHPAAKILATPMLYHDDLPAETINIISSAFQLLHCYIRISTAGRQQMYYKIIKRLTNNIVVGRLQVLLNEFFEDVSDAEQTIRGEHGADRH